MQRHPSAPELEGGHAMVRRRSRCSFRLSPERLFIIGVCFIASTCIFRHWLRYAWYRPTEDIAMVWRLPRNWSPPPPARSSEPLSYCGRLQAADRGLPLLKVSLAVIDPRHLNRLRLVGVGRTHLEGSIFCHYHLSNGLWTSLEMIGMQSILKDRKLRVDGLFIDCPLPAELALYRQRLRLSLSPRAERPGDALLTVHRLLDPPPRGPGLSACVAPLPRLGIPARPQVVAWVELQRLLGVARFLVFYDHSVAAADLDPVLRHYQRLGVAQVVDWRPGRVAAFGDCLHHFLVFAGPDAALLPPSHADLHRLRAAVARVAARVGKDSARS